MQDLKLIVITGVFSLAMGTALAEPTTTLPKVPDNVPKTEVAQQTPAVAVKSSAVPANGTQSKEKASEAAVSIVGDSDAENQIVQDRLVRIIEDDYAYEMQRRQLSNEVVLEKMRSDIRKLRGEDKKPLTPAPIISAQVTENKAPVQEHMPIALPHVVLEADIGGSRRVAVTDGKALRYVRAGEAFSMGGNDFKLSGDRKSVVLVEDNMQ